MGQRISGPNVGLPAPQYLYPSNQNPAGSPPLDIGNNYQTLAPGNALPVPAGSWFVSPGKVSVLQWLDPVTGVWRALNSGRDQVLPVISDGFNYRVANLTGCPVVAVVTGGGSGYPADTTVTADGSGGSTWQAIVGGMLSVASIDNAGAGYTLPPLLFIAAPPSPGVQATGYCTITSGTVSAITLSNVGAGYVTAPSAVIMPNPADPTYTTAASATLAVVGSGAVAAVLCTNPGASIASAPTLTVSGTGGSGATVSAVLLTTVVSATAVSAGTWTGGAAIGTVGGTPSEVPAYVNPSIQGGDFIPRPYSALASGASSTLASIAAVYDPGLFLGTPAITVAPVGGQLAPASTATITPTYGGIPDNILIQPAP